MWRGGWYCVNVRCGPTFAQWYDLLATNVMFTNGLKDPWHLLSINEDVPPPSGVTAVTYDLGTFLVEARHKSAT